MQTTEKQRRRAETTREVVTQGVVAKETPVKEQRTKGVRLQTKGVRPQHKNRSRVVLLRPKIVLLQPEVCIPRPQCEPATKADAEPVAEKEFQDDQLDDGARDSVAGASSTSFLGELWKILTKSFYSKSKQCLPLPVAATTTK